jgi:hypothetical protein
MRKASPILCLLALAPCLTSVLALPLIPAPDSTPKLLAAG